jgi:hypothetical protein
MFGRSIEDLSRQSSEKSLKSLVISSESLSLLIFANRLKTKIFGLRTQTMGSTGIDRMEISK